LGLGKHLAHDVGTARFDAGLVDRAGQDVGSPHHERRRDGGGGGDAAGGADAQGGGVAILGLEPVAQGQQGGQERDGGAIVRVPAGVGLGGEVLGHRDGS